MMRYRCHKIVEAQDLRDKRVLLGQEPDGSISVFIGTSNERYIIPANRVNSQTLAEIEDGYISWSPRKAFKDGYAAIPPDAA